MSFASIFLVHGGIERLLRNRWKVNSCNRVLLVQFNRSQARVRLACAPHVHSRPQFGSDRLQHMHRQAHSALNYSSDYVHGSDTASERALAGSHGYLGNLLAFSSLFLQVKTPAITEQTSADFIDETAAK